MKIKDKELDLKHFGESLLCIGLGTGTGIIVYGIFLYFNIAIFGWNLGLIFAPLAAGYVETIAANRILGKNLGAISAFILFIYTTYYSFILKNPTLGVNIITAGSIVVILQSAFPTLINYLLLVILGALLSNLKWVIKKFGSTLKSFITNTFRWETPHVEEDEPTPFFDEDESNRKLNSMQFFYMTSTDITTRNHDILGMYQSEVILDNKEIISVKRDEIEDARLISIKKGKDECLIKLVELIKSQGGNGVLDLNIQYGLIGLGGDNIHITANGMGIKINE
ncbi:hypothetical protein [Methanobrevibacter sp.]|uniref:hypothetical protein n=1 Tax=Methanobrevibacter sp. TaxID=66852 RepID=UPI003890FB02